jgi:alkylation response protein AidB-like acyl-CoA dehydrogenase
MNGYGAPLREIRFWLELQMRSSNASVATDTALSDDELNAVLGEAARIAEELLDPLYRLADEQGAALVDGQVRMPSEIKAAYAQFVEAGWVGLPADPDHGGQGLPHALATAVNEIWKSANLAFSLCPMLTQGAIEALYNHGSEDLRRRFLPNMIGGAWTGTMNLTESQAGSDLGALRTTAVREGDHYRLKGRKIFITWGDHDLTENIIHLVLARVEDSPPGVRGISMFVVPKKLVTEDGSLGEHNEITTVSIEDKLGIHGSPTCVLNYGDDRGAIGYLVGEENRGLSYMFTMMNSARLAVGVEGLAMAERAYQQALAYSLERVQGRRPSADAPAVIFEHPDVRRMLMLMKAGTDAMRALSYAAAAGLDACAAEPANATAALDRASVLTPIVKGWCTELGQELVSIGIQVHGGVGYVEETGAAQIFRDVRITTIYEGTTGIQANDLIGRKLISDDAAAVNALFDDVEGCLTMLDSTGERLATTRVALGRGLEAAREVVAAILEGHEADPNLAGATAVNFLMLMGTLLGGWQLALGACAAVSQLEASDEDRAFLEGKLVTSEFFAEHLMPRIEAYRATAIAGSRNVMGLSREQLQRF